MGKMTTFRVAFLANYILGNQIFAVEPAPFIPPCTEFVAMVRPKQLANSALVKIQGWDNLLKTLVATNGPVQQFLDNAGLDLFQQIDSVLIASNMFPILDGTDPTVQKGGLKPHGVIVFKGNFNSKKLIKAMETQGKENGAAVKKIKEGDFTLWVLPIPEMSIYVGISGAKKSVFIGNRKEDVIGCLKGGFSDTSPKELYVPLSSLDGNELIYLAGNIPKVLRKEWHQETDLKPLGDLLEGWSLGCMVTDKAEISLNMATRSELNTGNMKTLFEKSLIPKIHEEIAKANEMQGQNRDKQNPADISGRILAAYTDVLKKFKLKSVEKTFSLQFTINQDFLNTLLGTELKKP